MMTSSPAVVATMTNNNKDDIHDQMDELAMQLLILCQNLVDTKLILEQHLKEGFIGLAQSRYSMGGPASVSALQLPNQDWQPFEAEAKVVKNECLRQDINVRFNYLSLEVKDQAIEGLDSTLVQRKKKKAANEEEAVVEAAAAVVKKTDPIKWFGVLVPMTLRQSQTQFRKCIDMTVEVSNIQNEIRGLIGRRQALGRQLGKMEASLSGVK
jgi:hypothetical protein